MNIEKGWVFWSADFSMLATGKRKYGGVMLRRVQEDVDKFHKLTEEEQDKVDLYAVGHGSTVEEAINAANYNAGYSAPLP